MKLRDIVSHTNILVESEDDMFPGLDSSGFDVDARADKQDKPKAGEQDIVSYLNDLEAEQHRLWTIENSYHGQILRAVAFLAQKDALIPMYQGTAIGQDEVEYRSFDWFDKYPLMKDQLIDSAISKSSPLFNNIEKTIRTINSYQKRMEFFGNKRVKFDRKINKVRNKNKSSV